MDNYTMNSYEVKRDLTEDEKNENIENCLQNFILENKIPEN